MKIACIHATTTALHPIEKAFRKCQEEEIELLHFMDTGLLSMMEQRNSLTPDIINRFSKLVDLAVQSEVDCIQLTCSAFNNITSILQPLYPIKLFRSDESMLDEALSFERVGLISTVKATPLALMSYLKEKKPEIQVTSLVEPGLIQLLFQGKKEQHDERIKDMVSKLDGKVDVIVLSQYSLEHVAEQLSASVPILTAPVASAKRCLSFLRTKNASKENT